MQCAALFESYQSPWSKLGTSNLVSHDSSRPCSRPMAFSPNNPVLISSNTTATFALCTVPKSGCSNLRKLLYALVTDPVPPDLDALTQFSTPHFFKYPTVWLYDLSPQASANPNSPNLTSRRLTNYPTSHVQWQPKPAQPILEAATATVPSSTTLNTSTPAYPPSDAPDDSRTTPQTRDSPDQPAADPAYSTAATPTAATATDTTAAARALHRLPAHVPTFAIGRNPYLRLLSGFRDKMVLNPARRDTWTSKAVNTHFAVPPETAWENSPEGFRSFVRALWDRGVTAIDQHFQPAANLCGGSHNFRYDYYLRLEDLQNWFPCWMDGLGLRGWTESGWGDTPFGRMFIGPSAERTFVTLQSYRATAETTPQWDAVAGAATAGERGVDWDLISGSQCWWNPPGQSCEEFYAGFTAQDGTVLPGGLDVGAGAALRGSGERVGGAAAEADGDAGADMHATESREHWMRYYDQQTADLVFLLYAADFEAFGYERAVL